MTATSRDALIWRIELGLIIIENGVAKDAQNTVQWPRYQGGFGSTQALSSDLYSLFPAGEEIFAGSSHLQLGRRTS